MKGAKAGDRQSLDGELSARPPAGQADKDYSGEFDVKDVKTVRRRKDQGVPGRELRRAIKGAAWKRALESH